MYCKNCGEKIMNENAAFCPSCGTRRDTSTAAPSAAPSVNTVQRSQPVRSVPASSLDKRVLFTYFGLLIPCLITLFLPIFQAGGLGYKKTTTLFKGVPFLLVLSILLIVASACLALIPIICRRNYRGILFLPSKIFSFCNLFLLLLALVSAMDKARDMAGLVSAGLTVWGWIMVLSHIGVLVLSILISVDIKRLAKSTSLHT